MRTWRARAAATGFVLLLAAAACRQLVGIGDETPSSFVDAGPEAQPDADAGPVCGIGDEGATCEACLETSCCALAGACAGDTACKGLEECAGACSGDPTCRARCLSAYRVPSDRAEADLAACLAAHCAAPCNLTCGAGLAEQFGADAAVGCQACLAGTCDAPSACASDPECQAIEDCTISSTADDRAQACLAAHDAGLDAFVAFSAATENACRGACAYGSQWSCVGHEPPRAEPSGDTQMTLFVFDGQLNQAVPGVSVTVCNADDPVCSVPPSGQTGPDGLVTFTVPRVLVTGYGATGYLSLSGPGLLPESYVWGYPLSEPAVRLQGAVFTDAGVGALESLLGVSILPERALIAAVAFDCNDSLAVGARVEVQPSDAQTVVACLRGGLPTVGPISDDEGECLIVNVPVTASPVTVTVTPEGLGTPSSVVTGFVHAGSGTGFLAHPNQ
ncbi:MAG TPA: hypothetical protein VGG39_05965 [Polyangiaceae bacterium]|jgi:hypothetical protein